MDRGKGVSSGRGREGDRSGSVLRRRPTQRAVDVKFEPKIEWVDTAEAHVLVLELPGFKKEDVKVEFDGGENFTTSGEKIIEDQGWITQPSQNIIAKFKKIFPIPIDVEIVGIASRFENEAMYITFKKLKAPPEVNSAYFSDHESKSIPQVVERSEKSIEESSEKKDDKTTSNKLDQSPKVGNVEIPNAPKSSITQGEKELSNNIDQIQKDEKVESLEDVKSSATQDNKASNIKIDQSTRDEKAETLGGGKSTTSQDEKVSSNKLDQISRDEKVETPGDAKYTTTQDEKSSSTKPNQSPQDKNIETPIGVNSTVAQDEKVSSNKPDQIMRDGILETIDVAKSTVAQGEKESNKKFDQSTRDEKVPSLEDTKFVATQPIDEKVGNQKVVTSITTQEARDEKVPSLEDTKFVATQPIDEKVGNKKVVTSITTLEETQLEASKKKEELAKEPSLPNEEKQVDSNTIPHQYESLDSNKEFEMKGHDQHEHNLAKNLMVESSPTPPHGDQKEEKVSILKAKKEGDSSDSSQMKEDKWGKDKQSILKGYNYVSQFVSARRESMIVASIFALSLGLYITYRLAYSKD